MSAPLPDDDDLLAAELAFGLIDGAEKAAADARLGHDPAFAQAHARWQATAAAMLSDTGEAPRPSVWSAIAARLPANDGGGRAASVRGWRIATLAASVAALVCAGLAWQAPRSVIVRVPTAHATVAPMVAVLTGKKGFVTISFDPASGRMTTVADGLEMGDHAPELWVIPADGTPRSMGVLRSAGPGWASVPATAATALRAGVTLAVSVEPIGGSPTGRPTGPVILSGRMMAA